jgi:predicted acetyltransferase
LNSSNLGAAFNKLLNTFDLTVPNCNRLRHKAHFVRRKESPVEIRKITKQELATVEQLHQYAYGYWSDQERRPDDLEFMLPDETLGLFEKGQLQSTLSLLNLQQSVRGVLKGMGGISMVGTYPEARHKGYVKALMQAAFSEMHDRGLVVSMLEPFKESFYARFGYVPATGPLRLKAPLQSLRTPPEGSVSNDWSFERVRGVQAKNAFLDFITEFAPSHYHGFAIRPTMPDAEWNRRNKDALIIFVKRRGTIEAVARYRIKGYMTFEQPGSLEIVEMHWRSLKARAALFSFFAQHKDQVPEIRMRLPLDTTFHYWFTDLPSFIELTTWNPWMVRVVDAEKTVAGLPATQPGQITFKLVDPLCKWNNGTFTLASERRQLKISRTQAAAETTMTIEGLSALVYGTHPVEALELAGWVKPVASATGAKLSQWFPVLSLYNPLNY